MSEVDLFSISLLIVYRILLLKILQIFFKEISLWFLSYYKK
jgi:hypothetical protein